MCATRILLRMHAVPGLRTHLMTYQISNILVGINTYSVDDVPNIDETYILYVSYPYHTKIWTRQRDYGL